jgi:hypothetical protein
VTRTQERWCSTCDEADSISTTDRCSFCGGDLGRRIDARGRDATRRRGVPSRINDRQARVLHAAHLERRASVRELARNVHEQLGYRSPGSCVEGIRAAWARLGLDARDRVDATVLASTVHGRARRSGKDPDYRRELRERARAAGKRLEHVIESRVSAVANGLVQLSSARALVPGPQAGADARSASGVGDALGLGGVARAPRRGRRGAGRRRRCRCAADRQERGHGC